MTDRADRTILAAEGVSQRYPGVLALDDVSFDLHAGEVHALVGENGAGKSTLIRVLSGALRPQHGTLSVGGSRRTFAGPAGARACGIAAIFQELALIPSLSVAANVVLGQEPRPVARLPILSERRAVDVTRRLFGELGVRIDPRAPVARLSIAERQLVEIARAVAVEPTVLIMDEPTSSLAGDDVERLLDMVRQLRGRGTAVVFVSHRLDEVRAIADRITVMRNGRVVETIAAADGTDERLIGLMTGRALSDMFPQRAGTHGDVVLRVRGLRRRGAVSDVDLDVRAGEIVGVAGLVGAGRTETMRAIAGIDRRDAGTIELDGRDVHIGSPRDAIDAGIVYVPEDRKQLGLVLGMSSVENAALPSLRRFGRYSLVRRGRMQREVGSVAEQLGVRGRLDRPVRTLSGGNQQKVVLAKWLMTRARALILDEPTRGIDIAAKHDVYELVRALCSNGKAVVLVSSELPELLHLADRIVVMAGGRIRDRLDRDEFDERRILRAAFAGQIHSDNEEAA